jgi:hypothetical protein
MAEPMHKATPRVAMDKIGRAALIGGVLSVVGNLVVFFVAGWLGVNLQVTAAPGSSTLVPLQIGPVVAASLLPALPAGLLLAALARFMRNPWPVFIGISGVFLVLSFAGPINLPTDPANELVLNLMHVVSAVAIVGALWRLARA